MIVADLLYRTNLVVIEQNAFLDAILMVDIDSLSRPLVQDDSVDTQAQQLRAPPPTAG